MELEYSAKIEALGFKYSNSMTQAAQNPLLAPAHHHTPQKAAAEHTAVDAKGTPQASVLSATPSASTTSSAAAASTPSTLRSSFASLSNATGRLGMAGVNSLGVLSATKATPVAAAVVAPAHKDGISPLMEDLHSDMDSPSHGVHNAIGMSQLFLRTNFNYNIPFLFYFISFFYFIFFRCFSSCWARP